jgi:hypothetical protein
MPLLRVINLAKVKTISDYEYEIRMLYDKKNDPDIEKKLKNRVVSWADLVEVKIFAANNEQKPFKTSEIGYPIFPMQTKKQCGFQQVGDYQALYKFGLGEKWGTTLIERKGDDLYNTLMNKDGRERFYREISRFKSDPRFKRMVVLTDWSMNDFMTFIPPFMGSRRNIDHIGASVNSRYGTIASLFIQDVPVFFAGSRERAAKTFHNLIRQDIVKNYEYYLELGYPEKQLLEA